MTVRTAATARFAAHVRTPLYREGYALVLSAGLASALGLVYWIIAARTYSPSVVGLNAAAISAMLLLSGIAQLNLSSALTRFVPDAGRATWRLVAWSYAISIVASAAAAAVFLAGLDLWAPRLGFLRSSVGFALWLIAATTVWSVFTLQDSVLTGLRHAIWVPVDNTLYAVAKIGLLAVFATTFPRYGILASWTLGVLFSLVLINGLLVVRLIPAHADSPVRSRRPATARQIGRFVGADYLGGLFWLASSTLIPIAVTQRLGGSANAFFTLAWVMTMPLYLASANIGNSFVVSVVTDRQRLADYSRRVFAQTARIIVPAALGVALAAPFILRLIGEEYARQATPVLRLLALSAIPNMVSVLYLSVWRAEQRLSLLIWVRAVQCTCAIAASLVLLGPYGIRGPAIAWIVVQTTLAVGLFVRWPGVLTGTGEQRPRRPRGLFAFRNAAADSGLLAFAQYVKERPNRARRLAAATAAVRSILVRLDDRSSSDWAVQKVVRTVTDKTVAFVGPPGGSPRAVVKLAGSVGAAQALACEAAAMRRLAADTRLGDWRALVPRLLDVSESDIPSIVESAVPGVDAARLLEVGADQEEVLKSITGAIGELHRLTRTELVVDQATLCDWVDEPLTVLERYAARAKRTTRLAAELERLKAELRSVLIGRHVITCSVHGDYVPANVVLDPDGLKVRGILDWESARACDLPALDLAQLMLAVRMLVRRREFGEVVLDALAAGWTEDERVFLATFPDGSLPTRELVLLVWLRHTASILTKAPSYADNWLWTKANLEPVLGERG